ncbi:MAG: hypothetical protein AB1397_07765 [bacterium]
MIKQCNCENNFQDERYGKGMRVFNTAGKGTKLRCTVCGREIPMPNEKNDKKGGKNDKRIEIY